MINYNFLNRNLTQVILFNNIIYLISILLFNLNLLFFAIYIFFLFTVIFPQELILIKC